MRQVLTVLAVTTGAAHADSAWSEYSAGQPLRPAAQLVEASCDLTIELRGAIAEVHLQQRLTNPGPAVLAAMTELEIPRGAQLVGVTLARGRGKADAAVSVHVPIASERVTSDKVLGADPAIVTALAPRDARPRFRVLVQPLEPEQEIVLGTRWTAIADIRDGAVKLVVPGRGESVTSTCRGLVHAVAGPGTTIERIRVGQAEAGARGTAPFELGARDTTISAVLAFKRTEPVVWSQTAALGDGLSAQAITIATPALRSLSARRAVLVIDGSRSMELVGRHNVQKLVRAIGGALPQHAELEAIVFDRTPTRVLGSWKPATAEHLATIEAAIGKHTARNGSDPQAALALARQVIGDARGQALVILITDGVLGDVTASSLITALGGNAQHLDLHSIALAPGRMTAPDAAVLSAAVEALGGSHVEVPVAELDAALAGLDHWLRPAWLDLKLGVDAFSIPDQLRAGTGIVVTGIVPRVLKPKLTGHAEAPFAVAAASLHSAPLAQLALAAVDPDVFTAEVVAKLRARHPAVDATRAFAVLSSAGKVAADRRAMIAGGGPFTRMIAVDDPKFAPESGAGGPLVAPGGSAVDRGTVELLLRTNLQPAAFACYQRALATTPKLAGTARFRLEIGRGELTRAMVTGLGDATFDACLLDSAYTVTPPLPNPDHNADDRTIVNYPLTFSVREHKPLVLAGDADSSSPLDIDAIKGGAPPVRGRIKAGDTSTPLGNLRPAKNP